MHWLFPTSVHPEAAPQAYGQGGNNLAHPAPMDLLRIRLSALGLICTRRHKYRGLRNMLLTKYDMPVGVELPQDSLTLQILLTQKARQRAMSRVCRKRLSIALHIPDRALLPNRKRYVFCGILTSKIR